MDCVISNEFVPPKQIIYNTRSRLRVPLRSIDQDDNHILKQWLIDNVNRKNGCWEFLGDMVQRIRGEKVRVYRLMYALEYNRYIEMLNPIYRACRNTKCINPEHLTEEQPVYPDEDFYPTMEDDENENKDYW